MRFSFFSKGKKKKNNTKMKFLIFVIALIYGENVLSVKSSKVIDLNEDNWRAILENEWMIEL